MKKAVIAAIGTVTILGIAAAAVLAQQPDPTSPIADGVIQTGEYRNVLHDPITGMSLYWQNDAATLHVGLVSPGTGWAGVGFSDRTGKPGSNIIIGAVKNGTVTLQDNYGVTKQLHLPDWQSSLLATGGSETNGRTTLEFAIPLLGDGAQDVTLAPGGSVAVILAYQATKDGFSAEHTRYAQTTITLDP